MATDLDKLIVSLDADIRQLTNKLNRAGIEVDTFAKRASASAKRAGKDIGDSVAASSGSSGLSYGQRQEFGHIGRALIDEISAGQSPLRALQTEGARLVQTFGEGPGGVGGTFAAIGETILGLATPAVLVTGGITAIGAAALYAASSFDAAEQRIRLGLAGIGAGSNATIADVRRLGEELSRSQQISGAAGEDLALTLAKTGQIDVGNIGAAGGLARGYANLTGTDIPTAGKALADIFSDPASGADKLNAVLGTLDSKTRDYIRTLQAQNQQQAAVKALIDAVTPGIARAAEQTGFWASAWARVSDNAARYDEIARRVLKPTGSEEVANLTKQLDALHRGAGPNDSDALIASRQRRADAIQKRLDELQPQIKAAADAQKAGADAVNVAHQTDLGEGIVTGANAGAAAIKSLEDQVAALGTALDTPGVADKIAGGADKARATLDDLRARLATLREEYAAGGAAASDALREADYRSKTADLDGYAKAVADARHETERLIEAERKGGGDAANFANARRGIEAAGAAKIKAIGDEYLNKDSKYFKGVGDAPERYQQPILAAGAKYNLDPNYIAAHLFAENARFDPNAVSSSGAIGLGQFLPATARQYGVNPRDPLQSIEGLAHYLSDLKEQFGGNERIASAAYNAGPGTIGSILKRGGSAADFPAETRKYLNTIYAGPADVDASTTKQLDFAKQLDREYADQKASVDALTSSQGRNSDAVARAQLAQRLLDEAIHAGLPDNEATRSLVEARAAGLEALAAAQRRAQASAALRGEYDALGRTSDQQAVFERASQYASPGSNEFQGVSDELTKIQALTEAKGDIAEPFHSLAAALIEGKNAAEALKSSLTSIIEKFADKAIDGLVSSLFGGLGGGSGGGAGAAGGLLAGLGHLFGFASGGLVRGAGSATSDSVPAMLSDREFVVNAAATRNNLPLLQLINAGRVRRLAAGGLVSMAPIAAAVVPAAASGGSLTHAPVYNIDARGAQAGVAEQIRDALGAYDQHLSRNILGKVSEAQRRRLR